ncbi:MAG TPA: glycosyltransferase family 2 protein [Terriglobia bacterium]|nr:glycosyltransferase family 2 protein [Terriglobia bacterium]
MNALTKVSSARLVFVILISWNNWKDTFRCVASLEAMDYPNFRTVIIDNGSTDDSVAQLRSAYPTVPIIENGRNLGFSGGCNVGIRYALNIGADYVWLLNADTAVRPTSLSAMVDCAERDPTVGVVGSILYYMDDPTRIQLWGGGTVNFWIGRTRSCRKPIKDDELDFICGASMLIPRATLESVGLLDEQFFMFWEETDYCLRLRAAGRRLAVATESVVYHKGSAAFKSKQMLDSCFTESARHFFRKHAKFPGWSFWAGVCLSMFKRIIFGRWKNVLAVWPERLGQLEERDASRF